MKEIILTAEQIDKLTDMVRTLFYEYAESAIDEKGGYIYLNDNIKLEKDINSGTYYIIFDKNQSTDRIHWLEFCIFYIQPKIKYYISTFTIRSMAGKYIDLLYIQFKLLQNANNKGD